MKLNQIQLKHIFINSKIILFAQIEKLNSKKLLKIKRQLLKKDIEFRFVSNKNLKLFFSNIEKKKFLNLFKGDIVLFFSKRANWFFFYDMCKSIFNGNFFCWYILKRFYFSSNLIFRNKNVSIFYFLNSCLFNAFLKLIFFFNQRFISLIEKQFYHFFNVLKKIKDAK